MAKQLSRRHKSPNRGTGASGGGEDAPADGEAGKPLAFREQLRRRDLPIFLASVALFHLGHAADGRAGAGADAPRRRHHRAIGLHHRGAARHGGRCLGSRARVGRGVGRKPIFLLALAVLPVRGVLFFLTTSSDKRSASGPYAVVAIQRLDGVAVGIFGMVAVLIASDLMRRTGRFNLAQGLTALSVGIGAALSNLTAGYIVQWFGYATGFLYLAGIAACALAFFAVLMPETRAAA